MKAKALAAGKINRGRWEVYWSGGSAFAWDLGCFPLLLSLEIMTSRSSELCLSETVGSSDDSAPEPIDRDRHCVVKLLSHSDLSIRKRTSRVGKLTCFDKKKRERRCCSMGGLLGEDQAEQSQGGDSQSLSVDPARDGQNPSMAINIASLSCSRTVKKCCSWTDRAVKSTCFE